MNVIFSMVKLWAFLVTIVAFSFCRKTLSVELTPLSTTTLSLLMLRESSLCRTWSPGRNTRVVSDEMTRLSEFPASWFKVRHGWPGQIVREEFSGLRYTLLKFCAEALQMSAKISTATSCIISQIDYYVLDLTPFK